MSAQGMSAQPLSQTVSPQTARAVASPVAPKPPVLELPENRLAWEYARLAARIEDSGAWYHGKPYAAFLAIRKGQKFGWDEQTSLERVCVINGRTSVWGEALLAICLASKLFDHTAYKTWTTGTKGEDDYTWHCTMRRNQEGAHPVTREMSIRDAKSIEVWGRGKKMTLWDKWKLMGWTDRAQMYKPQNFCIRDCFPDVTLGMYAREDLIDGLLQQIDLEPKQTAAEVEREILEGAPVEEFAEECLEPTGAELAEPESERMSEAEPEPEAESSEPSKADLEHARLVDACTGLLNRCSPSFRKIVRGQMGMEITDLPLERLQKLEAHLAKQFGGSEPSTNQSVATTEPKSRTRQNKVGA